MHLIFLKKLKLFSILHLPFIPITEESIIGYICILNILILEFIFLKFVLNL